MQKKIKVMHMIWSMGDGGAQQVVINYLRDFNNDPDIEIKLYVYTKPTTSKYDLEIKREGYNVVYLNNPITIDRPEDNSIYINNKSTDSIYQKIFPETSFKKSMGSSN